MSGSSVPEAARAAAMVAAEAAWQEHFLADGLSTRREALAVALEAATPILVAAAVAEERATTARRIEAVADEIEAAQQLADFDGVVKMRPAEIASRLRAALASPGEGE